MMDNINWVTKDYRKKIKVKKTKEMGISRKEVNTLKKY